MKVNLILQEFNLEPTIKLLKNVLESPFFTLNGIKYSKSNVSEHHFKDSSDFFKNNIMRPLIHVKYCGSLELHFYENDIFFFDDKEKIFVKGDKFLVFSKTTVTKKEADLIENRVNLNNYFQSLYYYETKKFIF